MNIGEYDFDLGYTLPTIDPLCGGFDGGGLDGGLEGDFLLFGGLTEPENENHGEFGALGRLGDEGGLGEPSEVVSR